MAKLPNGVNIYFLDEKKLLRTKEAVNSGQAQAKMRITTIQRTRGFIQEVTVRGNPRLVDKIMLAAGETREYDAQDLLIQAKTIDSGTFDLMLYFRVNGHKAHRAIPAYNKEAVDSILTRVDPAFKVAAKPPFAPPKLIEAPRF